jgi:hypothetical protein
MCECTLDGGDTVIQLLLQHGQVGFTAALHNFSLLLSPATSKKT